VVWVVQQTKFNKRKEKFGMRNIKVFHMDDEEFKTPCNKRPDLPYDGQTRYYDHCWAWGSVVTNKALRREDRYAVMYSPEGDKVHHLTEATFKHFFSGEVKNIDHQYVCAPLQMKDVQKLRERLATTAPQVIEKLKKALEQF
jgi:hypothetical protein